MDSKRSVNRYTIDPDTGRRIVVNGPTWRRLSTKYYTNNDGSFTDELIPDQEVYPQERRRPIWRRRNVVRDPKYKRFIPILVGTDEWNKRYLEYEWDGHKFGAKREQRLPKSLNSVEKRREEKRREGIAKRQQRMYKRFDRNPHDEIDSKNGFAATHYNTSKGNMSKEWMNVKRTKKDFRTRVDIDEKKVWVHLPDNNNEEEVIPLNLVLNEKDKDEFREVMKKYIMKGMRDYPQCFVTIMAYNLMEVPQNSELKILNLTDDRLGHLRIVHRDRLNTWLNDYLKWYSNGVEEQETEGSGFVYKGWIGFHIEMFPLRTYIGYKHPTPAILGISVVNPIIDDNRCLQRSLILASEGGHRIIRTWKVCDPSIYNKWWKHPEKNTIFGHTVHEIEQEMDICDNKPFEPSADKFKQLETLLTVSINVFKLTRMPGYDDKTKDNYDHFICSPIYRAKTKEEGVSLCVLNDISGNKPIPKHFMLIKDLANFKHRIYR